MARLRVVAALSALIAAPAASAEEIALKFATLSPPGANLSVGMAQPWASRVNEQGKGLISVDVRDGMALANFTNVYERVLNDVVQIGWGLQNFIGGKFPLTEVGGLPFIAESSQVASLALWRLYASGALDAEYNDTVPIMLCSFPQARLHMTSPLKTLDNLNGLKIMVTNKVQGEALERIGAAPLNIPITDMYQSLQRGLVNGVAMAWPAVMTYKAGEVSNWHVDAKLGASTGFIFMAKKTYAALPDAARKVLDANSGERESLAFGRFWDGEAATGREVVMALKNDQKLVPLPPEIEAAWTSKMAPAIEAWQSSRPRGKEIYDKFKSLVAEARSAR